MKMINNHQAQTRSSTALFKFSTSLRSQLNILLLLHVLFFAFYYVLVWNGLLSFPWADGTVDDHIRRSLAVSSGAQSWPFRWTTSLFTYQFIHLSAGELLLSISMLWLFGHILKSRIGQWKVIAFYFMLAIVSALVFNFSHLVFPIFSDPGGFMEGAFGGVLGVMTTTVLLYGNHQFRIGRNISFRLWQVYLIALLLSLIFVYKNNMACILVYVFNLYAGMKYARHLTRQAEKTVLN